MATKIASPAGALPSLFEVLEGTTDCILLVDHDWRYVYLNENAVNAIGRGRDLIGMTIAEASPAICDSEIWTNVEAAARNREPFETEFLHPDYGRWFHARYHPIPTGMQISFHDVTEQRAADAAFRKSEELLRLALEATGDGAWNWNVATGELQVSKRFLRALGEAAKSMEPTLDGARPYIHPEDWPKFQRSMSDHIEGRADLFECEYRITSGNGEWSWNLDRGRIVARDSCGKPIRMVGIASDITERKRAEAQAREAGELLSLAQNGAGAGIWDLDLEKRVSRLCARSMEMHGFPPVAGEITWSQWQDKVHPDDIERVTREFQQAVDAESTYISEFRTLDESGSERWVMALGKTVDGAPNRFVGLNLDISKRRHAEIELKRVQSELIHMSRVSAMGTMASALAHEINQPLTAITNYIRGIRSSFHSRLPLDETCDAALRGAETSAERAGQILKGLRDHVSKGGNDRRLPANLPEIVKEASLLALVDGRKFGVDYGAEFGKGTETVLADRVQIQQVLLNLIRNAVEAMQEADCRERRLRISTRVAASEMVEVSVTDSGPGVPEHLRGQMFDPFVSGKSGGMGVGLSICRTIIEAHGGHIWAEPNPDGGTIIRFTLENA